MKLILFQIILLFPIQCLSQNIKDPLVLDSLYNSACNSTFVATEKVHESRYTKYFIASYNNNGHSLREVESLMNDFGNYPNIFRYLYDFRCIDSTHRDNFIGTFYFEIRLFPYKMWTVFDFYYEELSDTNKIVLKAVQNDDINLNARYKPKKDLFTVVETKDFEFKMMAKKNLPNTSRLSFTASTIPLRKIPRELYKLGIRIVFPRFIKDIERQLNQ